MKEPPTDCIFWIYSDAGTNVDGEVVSAGSARTFTFSAVGGVQYTVWGTDNRFHELGIVNTWTATLDHHALDLASEDPDPEDATATDFGSVLCADSDTWPRHDYYFADGNGNIVTLIDTNQSVSASYRYDPFGNITSQSGAMADANVYRFSSKEFHAATGLYYYGYRFYDPNLQRWVNRDPIGEPGHSLIQSRRVAILSRGVSTRNWTAGGIIMRVLRSEDVNASEFVENDPISLIDPDGLSPDKKKCCDVGKDIGKAALDKIWDKLTDVVKDKIKDALGGKLLPDAKEACDKIKCMDHSDANYAITCQMCAVLECAKKLPATAVALDNCLKLKFARCDGGEDP